METKADLSEETVDEQEVIVGQQVIAEAVSDNNTFTGNYYLPANTETLTTESPTTTHTTEQVAPFSEKQQNDLGKDESIAENTALVSDVSATEQEKGNTAFTTVDLSNEILTFEDNFPVSAEINSESFIRPQHNPAMDAYLKKTTKAQATPPDKKTKPKKRSFFRSVREKITLYMRKLTLSDIRLIDED